MTGRVDDVSVLSLHVFPFCRTAGGCLFPKPYTIQICLPFHCRRIFFCIFLSAGPPAIFLSGTLYGLMPLQISLSSFFSSPPLRRCARSMLQRHIPQLFTPDRRRLSFLHKMTAGKIFIKFFPDFGETGKKKSRPREFSRGNGKKNGKIRTRGRRCRPGPGHCGRS